MPTVQVTEIKKSEFYLLAKRTVDIASSIFLLAFFSPIIIAIAIAIKLDSRGPILADTPRRVGKNGKLFKMYKFRSMVENAHEILRENPKYSNLFNAYKKGSYKLKDDPRITNVGHFIRKHSLDEIPQALNILRARVLAIVEEKKARELREKRKSQIGTGDRSEKIRTYNFPQDRITDHRINQNWNQIQTIMDGDLAQITETLIAEDQKRQFEEIKK